MNHHITQHTSAATRSNRLGSSLNALAISLALAFGLSPEATYAQSTTPTQINIPAQSLNQALLQLGQQTDIQIYYLPETVANLNAPAVSGTLTAEQALAQLLRGTGIDVRWNGKTASLSQPASGGATQLAPITISGKAPGSVTEGTGSYTTWSTSSSTRLNLTPQETPQAITVITRQRIEDQGLVSLEDVLAATPGVTMKPLGAGADGPQMWARGASISNFQIDGIPTSTSMSNYLQNTVMYDRVEIVKGATGMMSGLGTPAATINMIRKRPTDEPLTSVSAEVGSWSRYGIGFDISRDLNDAGNVRGRLVADYKRQGAWTENYKQDYGVLYGIGEVDLGPRTLLTAGFSHITRNTDSQIRTFPIVYTNGQSTGATPQDGASPDWAYYDHRVDSIFGSVEHTFDSGWSAKAELTHARYKNDSVMFTLTGSVDQATGSGAYVLMPKWVGETKQTSLDAYVTGPFSLLGRQHELIGGITLSRVDVKGPSYPTAFQNITDIFNWADEVTEPSYTQSGHSSMKEYQYSAYLSSRFQVNDDLSLLLGSRITNWKRDQNTATYASNTSSDMHSRERNVLIPYVGIVYALNDNYSLYASYTKIYRPQDTGVLMYTNGGQMDPEKGVSYEAGIKASFLDGALTSSLSLFRTQQDNLALWNNALYTYEATNNTTTKGVELELAGELAPNWQVGAGYTYSESHNQHDERIMTRIPRNTFKLFTTYRLPGDWNKLTVGGGIHWESKTGDPLSTYTQNSYALLNLMARYEVSSQLSVTAHLNNALDKRYYGGLAGNIGVFGPPRNFMVSMKYNF